MFKCKNQKQLRKSFNATNISLLDDYLQVENENEKQSMPTNEFCLNFHEVGDNQDQEDWLEPELLLCEPSQTFSSVNYVYAVLYLVSSVFMFLALVIYIVKEDMRKSLIGKMQTGFLVNIFLNFLSNGVLHILQIANENFIDTGPCLAFSYFTYYTFISFFLWMNVISVSITYTFKHIGKIHHRRTKLNMFLNVLYAQGLPGVLSIMIAINDHVGDCSWDILPNMGTYNCFIKPANTLREDQSILMRLKSAEFLYYFLILIIVMAINSCCFLTTSIYIYHGFKNARIINMNTSNEMRELSRFMKIIFNLFILMGMYIYCEIEIKEYS